MKVREIMSRVVECCTPTTNLAEAAALMWKRDCGALPVLDGDKLAGIVTDRDMFIALGTRNQPAGDVLVQDVVAGTPLTCNAEDDVATAMRVMRSAKVRRLPVVNAAGTLEGILTWSDIAQHAVPKSRSAGYEETINTMKAICEHMARKPVAEKPGKAAVLATAG